LTLVVTVAISAWGSQSGSVSGFWFLVSGFWFLVSGFWFLVGDAFGGSGDSCVSVDSWMVIVLSVLVGEIVHGLQPILQELPNVAAAVQNGESQMADSTRSAISRLPSFLR
jgi:hypothetical protein